MKKIAFVTGMTGQDGPYLAKHLLENEYKVYGLVKRYSNPNLTNLNYLGIENDVELITGDITDDANMNLTNFIIWRLKVLLEPVGN
jgi:GDPmannose 4,6-dehydratase